MKCDIFFSSPSFKAQKQRLLQNEDEENEK